MKSVSLNEIHSGLTNSSFVAVDTEFERRNTFYPKLSLVQFANHNGHVSIVDALDCTEAERNMCVDIFLNPEVTKLFYSCSQDIEAIRRFFGITPVNVIDVQIVYGIFIGSKGQVSYADAVLGSLGHTLEKTYQFSDWMQRPLLPEQLEYASIDVFYLIPLYRHLVSALSNQDIGCIESQTNKLIQSTDLHVAKKRAWLKFWRYCMIYKAVPKNLMPLAKKLFDFRDKVAMSRDRVRKRVMSDDVMIKIIFERPKNLKELQSIAKFPFFINQDAILSILKDFA